MTLPLTQENAKIIGNYVADWWEERLQQGDKQIFHSTLSDLFAAELMRDALKPFARAEVDYDPKGILLAAVRASGIECRGFMFSARGILPEKCGTTVYPERAADPDFDQDAAPARLQIKNGYGQWQEPIPLSTIIDNSKGENNA